MTQAHRPSLRAAHAAKQKKFNHEDTNCTERARSRKTRSRSLGEILRGLRAFVVASLGNRQKNVRHWPFEFWCRP
jgi:hypothetical protein